MLRRTPGGATVGAPTGETFWAASATGTGEQQLTWAVTGGSWAVALMNADGSPGVDVSSTIGVRAGFLLPLALLLMGLGLVVTGIAVALIIRGASSGGPSAPPPPGSAICHRAARRGDRRRAAARHRPRMTPGSCTHGLSAPCPSNARLDEPLSRWLWLVKWFLAIPHFIVLGFLWIAFFVVAVVAFFAILFTGTYPRGLFEFNLGVLRWSWRVSYYCSNGGIGTDRYPPFSLEVEPDYPARLDIAYPEHLSRGLVLIKWWLLAIPHYLIVGLLVGGAGWAWTFSQGDGAQVQSFGWGVLGLLVLVAGVSLLFTGRYPRALFDLIIGLNRWVYRVAAYATLMTDVYPPFQLDEGGAEVPLPPPGISEPPHPLPGSMYDRGPEPAQIHRLASRSGVIRVIRGEGVGQGVVPPRRPVTTRAMPASTTSGPTMAHRVTPDIALPPTTPSPCRVQSAPTSTSRMPRPMRSGPLMPGPAPSRGGRRATRGSRPRPRRGWSR